MADVKILHNPRCSKSRQTLQLLSDKELAVDVIEYLKTPLNENELEDIKSKLEANSFRDFMRTKEAEYKTAGLQSGSSEEALRKAMVQYPKLIERPIVITATSARIGRPPEAVLAIL